MIDGGPVWPTLISTRSSGIIGMTVLATQMASSPASNSTPPDWHLDLLEEVERLNRLAPIQNDVVYVSRNGYLAMGKGGTAGEAALTDALSRAGVAVLDPARTTLGTQMALYAGAKLFVFAEGSAIHGRQLLGRV